MYASNEIIILGEEHWLGLKNIHQLTNQNPMAFKVELEKFDGTTADAYYSDFKIADQVL